MPAGQKISRKLTSILRSRKRLYVDKDILKRDVDKDILKLDQLDSKAKAIVHKDKAQDQAVKLE